MTRWLVFWRRMRKRAGGTDGVKKERQKAGEYEQEHISINGSLSMFIPCALAEAFPNLDKNGLHSSPAKLHLRDLYPHQRPLNVLELRTLGGNVKTNWWVFPSRRPKTGQNNTPRRVLIYRPAAQGRAADGECARAHLCLLTPLRGFLAKERWCDFTSQSLF